MTPPGDRKHRVKPYQGRTDELKRVTDDRGGAKAVLLGQVKIKYGVAKPGTKMEQDGALEVGEVWTSPAFNTINSNNIKEGTGKAGFRKSLRLTSHAPRRQTKT